MFSDSQSLADQHEENVRLAMLHLVSVVLRFSVQLSADEHDYFLLLARYQRRIATDALRVTVLNGYCQIV